MKFVRVIFDVFDTIINLTAVITCLLILLMMLSVGFDVAMRYFFVWPQAWVLETTEISLLYMTFLGAAWVLRMDGHVKMDLLLNRLNYSSRFLLNGITSLLCSIMCFIVTWYSLQFTWDQYVRNVRMTTVLGIPNAPTVGIIPIG